MVAEHSGKHLLQYLLSQVILLISAVTGHWQSFRTNRAMLAQQFAVMTPLLFSDCLSGDIFAIDLHS